MRKFLIPITIVALVALTGCDVVPAVVQVAVQSDGGQLDSAPAGPVYLTPDSTEQCNLMNPEFPMPCNQVLDVCADNGDGTLSSKFGDNGVHASYGLGRCTPQYPTWRDVCILQPQYISSYGYTEQECALATP